MENLTHAELLKTINEANRKLLCKLFMYSNERMFELEFEGGMNYLDYQCGGNQRGIDEFKSESFYWNWWMSQWHARNEMFIATTLKGKSLDGLSLQERRNLYNEYYWVHTKAFNSGELSQSYCYTMGEITKAISKSLHAKKQLA